MPSSSKVPAYLRRYCKAQDYARYTPREHATWRYILRQARNFFAKHAVPTYLDGLKKTGISINHIPSIDGIDDCLKEFGWGAVGVSGFIPPAAFLDFQARAIMPIAMDMRTLEHVAYTPAPDIVHEAAGHMPILVEPSYREYLKRYANMAKKAVISQEDIRLYEAIRALSDIKENPDTKPSEIEAAQAHLNRIVNSMTEATELAKVARMNWWTAEYGLVGDLRDPKIYGAGLLSSVGESQHCLTSAVRKVRLTVQCVEQSYDITEPQPQLFVAESLEQLPVVLEELDSTLSYRVGGSVGLSRALRSESVNSVVLENGFSASGILENILEEGGDLLFIKFRGPVQLAKDEKQLSGQGRERHGHGFSSPFGRWKKHPNKPASLLTDTELEIMGLQKGKKCRLEFTSGFVIEGDVINWIRKGNGLGVIQWNNCKVTRGSEVYYKPEWGEFDQLVGEKAVSVHGGPADREAYGEYELGKVSTTPGRLSPFTEEEKNTFDLYTEIEKKRERNTFDSEELKTFAEKVEKKAPKEWLLDLEILELAKQNLQVTPDKAWLTAIESRLVRKASSHGDVILDLAKRGVDIAQIR